MDDFDLDPEAVRRLGYRAADLVADHRAGLLERPVFGKVGDAAALFDEPLPEDGQPLEAVLDAVRDRVLAHPFGNSHPRFFAFINATADPVGTAADYLASAMNSNCWGGDHAAIHVERRVVAWLAEILGLPATAEGLLTSGGSMANFTALATARRAMAPDVREDGFAGTPPLVVYVSDEVHNCVDKAVDLLGIGWKQLRKIPTDDRFRIRVDLLKQAIAADRQAGLKPAIVVGNAGTVNTGAIDPLDELADLCAARGPLVPRGRGLRGAGLGLAEAQAALRGPRAGRLRRGRPAQVALRALRGRRHPRPRAGAHGRGLPPPAPRTWCTTPTARSSAPSSSTSGARSSRAASRRSRCGWA